MAFQILQTLTAPPIRTAEIETEAYEIGDAQEVVSLHPDNSPPIAQGAVALVVDEFSDGEPGWSGLIDACRRRRPQKPQNLAF